MRACKECRKRYLNSFFFPVVIGAALIGAVSIWICPGDVRAQAQSPSPPRAGDRTEYWAKAVRMADVSAKVENGKISIPVDVLKEKKIVRYEYEGSGVKVPLLSYLTPAGKLITAVSVCEPCRSTRFHIRDKSLVCNACYTEWNLETLKGIKGGCLKYPPQVIPHSVENGRILIDEKTVTQWKPRV